MQPVACVGAIETAHHEAVIVTGEFASLGRRDVQAAAPGQSIYHHFPAADIVSIPGAGELGDVQIPFVVSNARLGSGTAQRAARSDEHAQPILALCSDVIRILLKRTAGLLQSTHFSKRWSRDVDAVIEKVVFVFETKTQCTHPIQVVYTKQIIRFVQTCLRGYQARALVALETTIHQHASPPIRTGVVENTELVSRRRRILRPAKELDARIQLQPGKLWIG